ncbi:MAG: phosphohydrolase, partial [Caldiserica bacterium]|nr:phosphohydrolase [Caldisericota bacterium]
MREEILRIFPEIGWIEDEGLREGVIRTYERAL